MSPETMRSYSASSWTGNSRSSGEVDARADLFSLGVVLYRLSTGQLPFKGTDSISTLIAIATHQPLRPERFNSTLPPALSDLVMRLLEKAPGSRLSSTRDVVLI